MGPPHGGTKTRSGAGTRSPKNRNFPLLQKVCLAWDQKRRNLMIIWAPLTLSDRSGPGGPGPGAHFPRGRGTGQGPIVFRVRYASRSGNFFPGLRGLGNFFRGASRYRKIILDQKTLIVRARAPPHRQYAIPQNFSRTQSCFEENFSQNIHEHQRKNAKSAKKFTLTHTIKSLFLSLCELLCEA